MKFCTQCGRDLEGRRTCSGCGALVAVEPPPAPPLPAAGARYPLYADGLSDTAPRLPSLATTPASGVPLPLREPAAPSPGRSGRVRTLLVGFGLLAGLSAIGLWLLLHHSGSPLRAVLPDVPPPVAPTKVVDLTGSATASAPDTDAPGVDTAGNPTSYAASNMLDGDAGTAWRMAGDGTGEVLTFTFPQPVRLTEVGLINGYAKSGKEGDRTLDWYDGNRRVLAVEWVLDDGTVIGQDLRETRSLQTVAVPGLSTTSVRLRLVEVSEPGHGPAGRDNTSISDVSFAGR